MMMRCYLLCLLTLALCCTCGLVWAEEPKSTENGKGRIRVGVPPFITYVDADVLTPGTRSGTSNSVQSMKECKRNSTTGCVLVIEQTKENLQNHQSGTVGPQPVREISAVTHQPVVSTTGQTAQQPSLTQQPDAAGARSEQPSKETATSSGHTPNTADRKSPQGTESHVQQQEGVKAQDAQNGETTQTTGGGTGDGQETSATASHNTVDTSSNTLTTGDVHNRNAAQATDGATPVEGKSTTTTTTTTTTTLPPVPANSNKKPNVKGDADSSSISYLWVRVPLLIVVALTCILV